MTERYPEPRGSWSQRQPRRRTTYARSREELEPHQTAGHPCRCPETNRCPGAGARALVGMLTSASRRSCRRQSRAAPSRSKASGLLSARVARQVRGLTFARRGASAEGSYGSCSTCLCSCVCRQKIHAPSGPRRASPVRDGQRRLTTAVLRPRRSPSRSKRQEVLTTTSGLSMRSSGFRCRRRLLEPSRHGGEVDDGAARLERARAPRSAKGHQHYSPRLASRSSGAPSSRCANRHLIPAEVAAIVGAERKLELESRREVIKRESWARPRPPRAVCARSSHAGAAPGGRADALANSQGDQAQRRHPRR
jgi:hypothetical protein